MSQGGRRGYWVQRRLSLVIHDITGSMLDDRVSSSSSSLLN